MSSTKIRIYGSDERIVNCARVSFNKDARNYSIDKNINLIRYLYTHKHYSPFEHCVIFIEKDLNFPLENIYQLYETKFFDLIKNNDTLLHTFLQIRKSIDNFSPIFYSINKENHKEYIVLTLRTYFQSIMDNSNVDKNLKYLIENAIREKLPATYHILKGINDAVGFSFDYKKENIYVEKVFDVYRVKLIDYTEFGIDMDYYTFYIETPIFVARQWFRHRFGNFNEISRRYVDYDLEFFTPDYFRKRDKNKKQGSKDEVNEFSSIAKILVKVNNFITHSIYKLLLNMNVPPEQARIVLPQNLITKFYWTVPKISLKNFLELRTDENSQKEIREYAEVIKTLIDRN